MILRIGFAPRRAGLSSAAFLEHWRSEHADAASRLPGLRRYIQLHPVMVGGVHALGYPGFDACSMLVFDDLAAMDAAFASRVYRGSVATDESRFVDKGRFGLFLGAGDVPEVSADGGTCWLVSFLRRHPAVPADALVTALREDVDEPSGLRSRHVIPALDEDRPEREARAFDAVELSRFPDVPSALAWVGSPDAERSSLPLAGLTAGMVRLLAEPAVVR